MKDRGKNPRVSGVRPRRATRPWDEAAGDRSYGDRAAGAEPDPDPAHRRPPDGSVVREGYDATAEAARAVSGRKGSQTRVTERETDPHR